jgi:hypothetical protein
MLVAAIDRNQPSEGGKFVAKVVPSPNCIPVAKNVEFSKFRRQFPTRKGIILRNEDKRHGDRRNRPPESTAKKLYKDRRHTNNRAPHPSWNRQTHEVIVIAVEKDKASPKKWNVGEEVVVGPAFHQEPGFAEKAPVTNYQSQGSQSSPSFQIGEQDYIVSLSPSAKKLSRSALSSKSSFESAALSAP